MAQAQSPGAVDRTVNLIEKAEVKSVPRAKIRHFLKQKDLSDEEIDVCYERYFHKENLVEITIPSRPLGFSVVPDNDMRNCVVSSIQHEDLEKSLGLEVLSKITKVNAKYVENLPHQDIIDLILDSPTPIQFTFRRGKQQATKKVVQSQSFQEANNLPAPAYGGEPLPRSQEDNLITPKSRERGRSNLMNEGSDLSDWDVKDPEEEANEMKKMLVSLMAQQENSLAGAEPSLRVKENVLTKHLSTRAKNFMASRSFESESAVSDGDDSDAWGKEMAGIWETLDFEEDPEYLVIDAIEENQDEDEWNMQTRFRMGSVRVYSSDALVEMKKGSTLRKFGKRGAPKFRRFEVSEDNEYLQWFSEKKSIEQSRIAFVDMDSVEENQQHEANASEEIQATSFTVVYGNNQNLKLTAKNATEANIWSQGLAFLIGKAAIGIPLSNIPRIDLSRQPGPNMHVRQSVADILGGRTGKKGVTREQSVANLQQELATIRSNYDICMEKTCTYNKMTNSNRVERGRIFESLGELGTRLTSLDEQTASALESEAFDVESIQTDAWNASVDVDALKSKIVVLISQQAVIASQPRPANPADVVKTEHGLVEKDVELASHMMFDEEFEDQEWNVPTRSRMDSSPVYSTDALLEMKKGASLLKHGKRGTPKFRRFEISEDNEYLQWFSEKKDLEQSRIAFKEMECVMENQQHDAKASADIQATSFTIVYGNNQNLRLTAKNPTEAYLWTQGLATLVEKAAAGETLSNVPAINLKKQPGLDMYRRQTLAVLLEERTGQQGPMREKSVEKLQRELANIRSNYELCMEKTCTYNQITKRNRDDIERGRIFAAVGELGARLTSLDEQTTSALESEAFDLEHIKTDAWNVSVDINALKSKLLVLIAQQSAKPAVEHADEKMQSFVIEIEPAFIEEADPVPADEEPDEPVDALLEMKKGTSLMKYGKRGQPKFRRFEISEDNEYLQWFSEKKGIEQSRIAFAAMRHVEGNQQHEANASEEIRATSFRIVYGENQSLRLTAKDTMEAYIWTQGLATLIEKARTGALSRTPRINLKKQPEPEEHTRYILACLLEDRTGVKGPMQEQTVDGFQGELAAIRSNYEACMEKTCTYNQVTKDNRDNIEQGKLFAALDEIGTKLTNLDERTASALESEAFDLEYIKTDAWNVSVDIAALKSKIVVLIAYHSAFVVNQPKAPAVENADEVAAQPSTVAVEEDVVG